MESSKCPKCLEHPVWENMVDTTNDEGHPIELKLKSQEVCECCGSILEQKWLIPKKGGHKIKGHKEYKL